MSLFAIELRRIARSPLVWLPALAALALALSAVWDLAPDMTIEPVRLQGWCLLLAAGVLLAAQLAGSRDRRDDTAEGLAALPLRADARIRAVALATGAVGSAAAAVVVGAYLAIRLAQGPVAGSPDPFELLAIVAATALAAALGVALARWAPSLLAAPVVVVGIAMLTLLNRNLGGFGDWFLPLDLHHDPDWPARPAGLHLLYLLAGVVLCWALALLHHRPRPLRIGLAVAALAVALPAAAVATSRMPEVYREPPIGAPPGLSALDGRVRDDWFGAGAQTCERRAGVRFCAFRPYAPWIPLWSAAVEPVAAALPPAVRRRVPAIRQQTASWSWAVAPARGAVPIGLAWNRADDAYRLWLAGSVAATVTGLRAEEACDARGQARAVVALWLLAQGGHAVPAPAPVSIDLGRRIHGTTGLAMPTPIDAGYGSAEVHYAQGLLTVPDARARVRSQWDELMRLPLARALPLLGLDADVPIAAPEGKRCA
jgi:hypothetical protein